ncbi:flavodoxin and radical sam domain containing protein [Grosmannia clavigera kw1407]|uniref:tRNA 4-demethylwyosine synthase (AdoMet-dependent) n=1 Tax=Grosmannia clavigera (strain kw1407 / UAMH 11150) TaxID=655863 RepID=F0XFH7_GROCL|nr:flavodoxin and radical sam domain containing protein [Grosmannia clavigera kw1407]EFX03431.1 flavodoxin and radical sam domain containing protein [Grosmannia clavigera kw1407]
MGTGIVSILLHNLPYSTEWMRYISIAIFALNISLFSVFMTITMARYILYPEIWAVMIKHPAQSLFLGCIPMGFATIINMLVFVCARWGNWAIYLAWGLWWVDVAMSCVTSLTIPFIMVRLHKNQLSNMTAALLLPVVPVIVAAASGGIVAEVLPNDNHAVITLVVSYIIWGLGQAFSFLIMSIYFLRLQVHDLPPREAIVSVFLPIGPLGQGGFAIQQLGKVAIGLLPVTGAFNGVSIPTGSSSAMAASAMNGGVVLYMVGILCAFVMWGAALGWLAFAIFAISTTRSFPFNMGWWGFTFPLGVFTTCTGLMATELSSIFLKVLTEIFSILILCLWAVIAAKTVLLALTGDMFYAPSMASTVRASSPVLRDFADGATDIWHHYRIPIILSTFAILVSLRIYFFFTDKGDDHKEGLLVFPKIYNADDATDKSKVDDRAEKAPATVIAEVSSLGDEKRGNAALVSTEKPASRSATTAAGPRRIKGELPVGRGRAENGVATARSSIIQSVIFFSSLTGATAKIVQDYATKLGESLESHEKSKGTTFAAPQVLDLAEVDYDEYFITPPTLTKTADGEGDGSAADFFYLFLIPSYNIDSINDTFLEHLKETHHDFRIDTAPLTPLIGYSVFGFGDKEGWPTEEEGFCTQAKEIDKWMAKLSGRKRAFPLGFGDSKSDAMVRLAEWSDGVVEVLDIFSQTGSLGEGVPGSGDPTESDDEEADDEDAEYEDDEVLFSEDAARSANVNRLKKTGIIDDVEDLGRILQESQEDSKASTTPAPIAVDFTSYDGTGKGPRRAGRGTKAAPAPTIVREMVAKDSPTYKSLTKQGYAVVGSHSGVKICRWTKSALRGRGSCYKYSFYGIHSHQCMETTPSLSCSNKCVFCWRHGTNPVGTSWRWVVDPPDLIFNGVKANHYQKIRTLRGVPGVRAERFAEAMRIRHCALSLVGEPIFYPHINEFLGMLHSEDISSFLVCNAQHPDQLAALHHVTQLYVSIDAANRDSLRKIDRPLHRDFWERFQRCLEILREKRFRQRTVFRLTLVKGFNIEDEVRGYADLVEKALPCFIEIKGVTYCGTSTSAGVGLTMANVPFYHEVCDFVVALDKELRDRGLAYGLAAEHAHSCCVLIASERFRVDGRWHTLIDYDKFFALLREKGPDGDFSPEDYMGEATPEWANWGQGGFDPRDQRVDRKGRPIMAN